MTETVRTAARLALFEAPAPFTAAPRQAPMTAPASDPMEPLIGAALLTAAAFRLRDEDALCHALRLLVEAAQAVEAV